MHAKKLAPWGLLTLGVGSLVPSAGLACEPLRHGPETGSVVVTTEGIVLVVFDCVPGTESCTAGDTPAVHVQDTAGQMVAGAVIRSGVLADRGVWIAWQPAEPLTGTNYDVVSDDTTLFGEALFSPTDTYTLDPTSFTFDFSGQVASTSAGDKVCCDPAPYFSKCGDNEPCFWTERHDVVSLALSVQMIGFSPAPFRYLYRVSFSAADVGTQLPDRSSPNAQIDLENTATTYCYKLDVVDPLTDQAVHSYNGCQPLNLDTFAARIPTDAERRADLSVCAHAPAGYEADWTRLGFTDSARDASIAMPSDTGAQTRVPMAPSQPDGGVVAMPVAHEVDGVTTEVRHDGDGCSLAPGAGGGSLLAALLMLLRRRRRAAALRGSRWNAWLLSAVFSCASLVARSADACTGEPPTGPLDGSAFVTADGTVQFLYHCSVGATCSDAEPPGFHVEDGGGNLIAGSIVSSGVSTLSYQGVWFVWKPQQPLQGDGSFFIKGEDTVHGIAPFTLAPVMRVSPAALPVSFSASVVAQPSGDQVCCDATEAISSCRGPKTYCFQKNTTQAVLLQLEDQSGTLPIPFEYLYEATFRSSANEMKLPQQMFLGASFSAPWTGHEYCFSVDAIDPTSSARIHVADGCKSLDVSALESAPITDEALEQALALCATSPAGYEDGWQQTVAAHVADGGVSTPDAPVHVADAAFDSEKTDESTSNPKRRANGCALASAADASSWCAGLLVLLRRRRARRDERSAERGVEA